MILATRIPALTERLHRATIRAIERHPRSGRDQHLIDELECSGYRVTRQDRLA